MKTIPTQTDGQTSLAASDFNQIPDELETAITSSGQTLDGNFTNQLSRSIIDLGMNAGFYTDSGTANNIILSNSNNPTPTSLRDGIEITFKAGSTNTGATTINLAGFGSKSVKNAKGNTLSANEITANNIYNAIYQASTDDFLIIAKYIKTPITNTVSYGAITGRGSYAVHIIETSQGYVEQIIFGLSVETGVDIDLPVTYISSYQVLAMENSGSQGENISITALKISGNKFKLYANRADTGSPWTGTFGPSIRCFGIV